MGTSQVQIDGSCTNRLEGPGVEYVRHATKLETDTTIMKVIHVMIQTYSQERLEITLHHSLRLVKR
jgi:hypothetical protein